MLLFLVCLSRVVAAEGGALVVVASGETHAVLDAGNFPDDSGRGLRGRAHVLDSLRALSEVLLVDAGGFCAGGIYDLYTCGRYQDSLRSLAMLREMGRLRYDAVAIGDDDLRYGGTWLIRNAARAGVPLVCANCCDTDDEPLAPRFLVVEKKGVRIGISAVTTQEAVSPLDTGVILHGPVESLRRIWDDLVKVTDHRIVLSHLGEEQTLALADSFPDCGLLVNSHRKTTPTSAVLLQGRAVMQFGFQGRRLSVAENAFRRDSSGTAEYRWVHVPDQGFSRMEARPGGGKGQTVLDLYLMSRCPYGLSALSDMLQLSEDLGDIELHVWFIGEVDDTGILISLHGSLEIEEELVWLAVAALYPETYHDFLYLRAHENLDAGAALGQLGIDTSCINPWIRRWGRSALTAHYTRCERLNVVASPTLLVNNLMYEHEVTRMRLASELCGDSVTRDGPTVCDSLPECFADADCRQRGKRGECVSGSSGRGECRFSDAVRFTFTVVSPDSTLLPVGNTIVQTTRELFPGVETRVLRNSSRAGRKILRTVDPIALPLYLFDRRVREAAGFLDVEMGLVPAGKWLTFRAGVMKNSFFHKRTRIEGAVEVFVDPLLPGLGGLVEVVLGFSRDLSRLMITPNALHVDSLVGEAAERYTRAIHWIALQEHRSEAFVKLLHDIAEGMHSDTAGHSHGPGWTVDVQLPSTDRIDAWQCELVDLGITEPVEVLLDNQELVPVGNREHLGRILTIMGAARGLW